MSAPEALPCRWKHLRGSGRKALYRATCGRGECRGHLGDLCFVGTAQDQTEILADLARHWYRSRRPERPDARDDSWATEEDLVIFATEAEEVVRQLGRQAADERAGRVRLVTGWMMLAFPLQGRRALPPPTNDTQPIYWGHRDSGYRISFGGKRSQDGVRVGHRPLLQDAPSPVRDAFGGSRPVQGQTPRPTDCIWCPICGTLNRLEWPEPLKDSQAR
jgi:hypothetical protein